MDITALDTSRRALRRRARTAALGFYALIAILCVTALPLQAQNAVPSGNPVSVAVNGTNVTLTATYVDALGAGDIQAADLWVTDSIPGNPGSAGNACVIEWRRSGSQLFLVNDAGTAFSSFGVAVGVAGLRITNSQCAARSDEGTAVSLNGNTLTLTVGINFNGSPMSGNIPGLFQIAEDGQGRWSTNFTTRFGQLTVPASKISACHPTGSCTVSATPQNTSSTTFHLSYFDENGFGDIAAAELHIMNHAPGSIQGWSAHVCIIQYNVAANSIVVSADAGGSFNPGPSNSQCSATLQSVQKSGDNLTLQIFVQFSPSFAGAQNLYLEADSPTAFNNNFQNIAATYNVP